MHIFLIMFSISSDKQFILKQCIISVNLRLYAQLNIHHSFALIEHLFFIFNPSNFLKNKTLKYATCFEISKQAVIL